MQKLSILLIACLMILGLFNELQAQMVQFKGLEFYQKDNRWSELEKDDYKRFKTSHSELSETFLVIDTYNKENIENKGEYYAKIACTRHLGPGLTSEMQVDKLDDFTEVPEGLKFLRYKVKTEKDGQKIWGKIWAVEYPKKNSLFIFTAVYKDTDEDDYGTITKDAIEALDMMLKTIRIKQ